MLQRTLDPDVMNNMIRYLANRVDSLESVGLDFRIMEEEYFER